MSKYAQLESIRNVDGFENLDLDHAEEVVRQNTPANGDSASSKEEPKPKPRVDTARVPVDGRGRGLDLH